MIPQFPNESSGEVIEYTAESDAAMLHSAEVYSISQRKAKQAEDKERESMKNSLPPAPNN